MKGEVEAANARASEAEGEAEKAKQLKRMGIGGGRRSTMANGSSGFDMGQALKNYLGQ